MTNIDNNNFFTIASPLHFISGILLGFTTNRLLGYSALIVFEISEQIISRNNPNTILGVPEGPVNVLTDIGVGILGYEIGKKIIGD